MIAFIAGLFLVFSTSFSHIATSNSMGMMSMDAHFNVAQCQSICNVAVENSNGNKLVKIDVENKLPQPAYGIAFTTATIVILLFFVINRLYLLSSWRPPDLVILHGLYRSGL